ncbi:MAG: AraC family transcriptional regulator [Defluviitaleaceae bacterium]|nr:AraC family transcriptional regulator [Defluviitaleaceae bacterium]
MRDLEKVDAVSRMQKHIITHIDQEITMQDLSNVAGYSLWYSIRVFKELLGKTPFEYIRALRLTTAAQQLRDLDEKVIDVALSGGFGSHDGFTRAFSKQFDITPKKYRIEKPAVSYFTHYPIRDYYYLHKKIRNDETMKSGFSSTVTVQAVTRPERKLILLRSENATDYFSFCGEKGCEWEGLLNSIPEKFDNAAILELPTKFLKKGTSSCAVGVEVPNDYNKTLPEGYEMIDLPQCTMLYFHGMPFENEDDFGKAIDVVIEAIEAYKPELYGYAFSDDIAPRFNFGATNKIGAKMSIPVTTNTNHL